MSGFWCQADSICLHDSDGNLMDDGQERYTCDAENRLVEIRRKSDNALIVRYRYDHMSRRVLKPTTALAPQSQEERAFIYDGWNPIAEYQGQTRTTLTHQRSYTWGPDLSGSMQGAGGVGGLRVIEEKQGTHTGTSYPLYDGDGNVTELVKSTTGTTTLVAHYEYDPFGKLTESQDSDGSGHASVNDYKFSTKYQDEESKLYYYGYRYYDPQTGRWPSRDPIGEGGGKNLYALVSNTPIGMFDILGLSETDSNGGKSYYTKIVAKSFIDKVSNVGGRGKAGDADGSNQRLAIFASTIGKSLPFNFNPPDDEKDGGRSRLYGMVKVSFCCMNGKLKNPRVTDEDKEGGNEGPVDGTIDVVNILKRKSTSEVEVSLISYGRLATVAGVSIQAVKPRKSYYIWNDAIVTLTCEGKQGKHEVKSLRGSKFPSRKLWVNGEVKRNEGQGALSDLWQSGSSTGPERYFVAE